MQSSSDSTTQSRILSTSLKKALQWRANNVEVPLEKQIWMSRQFKRIPVVPAVPAAIVQKLVCREPLESVPRKYPDLVHLDISEFDVTYKQIAILLIELKHLRKLDFANPEELDIDSLTQAERLALLRFFVRGGQAEDAENIALLSNSIIINPQTHADLLSYAQTHGLKELQTRCEEFLKSTSPSVENL